MASEPDLAMSSQPNKVLRLATDADYEYFTINGSSQAATNNRILSILNMVQGMYFAELDIDLQVVLQHVWVNPDNYQQPGIRQDIPCDNPATQNLCLDGGQHLLEDFRDYWNGPNRPLPISSRDAVHLFTNKAVHFGGLAYVRYVCSNPQISYGWTKYSSNSKEGNGALLESNIVAHEIGHNLGADHTPPAFPRPQFPNEPTNQENCFNRDADQFQTEMPFFCPYTKNQILSHIAGVPNCLLRTSQSPPAPVKQSFDFDGDTKAGLAVFRPAAFADWIVRNADGTDRYYQYGTTGDIPVAADYDGDRRTDLAVFRPGASAYFHLLRSTLGRLSIPFGTSDDIPVQGDYDGDERVDVAIFRPSSGLWAWRNSINGQVTYYSFGQQGDIPVQADYDGDGKTDYGVFRASTGLWYIQQSSAGFHALAFGQSGDFFVPADYDGDRKADIAVFRPSTNYWYIQRSSQGYTSIALGSGALNDVPIVGDYDGDGKADQAVKSNFSNFWSIIFSSTGQVSHVNSIGQTSDIPIGFRNPQ